mmetsp:Transcript_25497/g.49882  ORF Transcript_25497/g.49882 Transcript_25497/m.49882 type:complete len:137 (-) Transcript_25497:839-1249(-)
MGDVESSVFQLGEKRKSGRGRNDVARRGEDREMRFCKLRPSHPPPQRLPLSIELSPCAGKGTGEDGWMRGKMKVFELFETHGCTMVRCTGEKKSRKKERDNILLSSTSFFFQRTSRPVCAVSAKEKDHISLLIEEL